MANPRTRPAAMIAVMLAAVMLIASGCGGDDDDTAASGGGGGGDGEQQITELTATTPFPSAIVFYPLYVAQAKGYLEEEGIELEVEPVDGSGSAMQQVLSGQADFALATPTDTMAAVQGGAELTSVYTMYQQGVFSVVVEQDSPLQNVEQLRGKTIGVGSMQGGETDFVRAMLSARGDMQEGEDYKLLAVGEGGQATVAVNRGEVDAYAASFPDVAIMRLRGLELRNIVPDDFQQFFDSTLVFRDESVENQPEVIEGLGRALAKATEYGLENPEEVVEISGEAFPEEAGDQEFALALLKETQSLYELPPAADGKWGFADPEAVTGVMDFLVETGELEEPIDAEAVYTNRFVDAYNDYGSPEG